MKTKSILFFLMAVMFNCITGSIAAFAIGIDPVYGAIAMNAAGVLLHFADLPAINLYTGLAKEIWLSDIMEAFYPDSSFLNEARGMDQFVDNDKINLAEAGIEPSVLINNTTYPVPFAERSDTPLDITLDYFDTEGTVIRNAELAELAYDKRGSIVAQHKNALLKKFAMRAIHAYAPASDAALTPVIAASGNAWGSFKSLSFADLLDMASRFDMLDVEGTRVLVLHPVHYRQLVKEDLALMKDIINGGKDLFGFKPYRYSKTPTFNKSTGAKAAFGAAAAPSTDTISSVVFVGNEVMKARGTFDMFERLNDPEQKGDIINFQMRGIALPLRNKYIGAFYSPATT